ncbi:MAG: hypothetical protein GXP24_05465 [Planctomycetes bacterium]|nr:hypothetical protein [Planctomycetota bacterium]
MNTDKHRFYWKASEFPAISRYSCPISFQQSNSAKKPFPHLRLSVFICGFSFFFFQRSERLPSIIAGTAIEATWACAGVMLHVAV